MGVVDRVLGKSEPNRPAAALLRAMHGIAERDDAQSREALYRAMLAATFLVPTAEAGGSDAAGGPSLGVVAARGESGEAALLAFTDRESMRAWRDGAAFVEMAAADLFRVALANQFEALLINVAGPLGGGLSSDEMRFLADGLVPIADLDGGVSLQLSERRMLRISPPVTPPAGELLEAVRVSAAQQPLVGAAYVFAARLQREEEEAEEPNREANIVVGIQFASSPDDETRHAVFRALGDGVRPALAAGEFVDFLALSDAALLADVRAVVEPVFERGG